MKRKVEVFPLSSCDNNKLKALQEALAKAGVHSSDESLTTTGTLLKVEVVFDRYVGDDMKFYTLSYGDFELAVTRIKSAPWEWYSRTSINVENLSELPSTLIGELREEPRTKTGFEDKEDYMLQTLVHAQPDRLSDIAAEAIKRAVEDPSKEWIVCNVVGAVTDDAMKRQIEADFNVAKSHQAAARPGI